MTSVDNKTKIGDSLVVDADHLKEQELRSKIAVYEFLLKNKTRQIILHPTTLDPATLRKSWEFRVAQILGECNFAYVFCLTTGEASHSIIYSTGEQVFFSHNFERLLQLIPEVIVCASKENYNRTIAHDYKLLLYDFKGDVFNDVDFAAVNNPKAVIITHSSEETALIRSRRHFFIIEEYRKSDKLNALKLKAIVELYLCNYESRKLNAVQDEITDFYKTENPAEPNYYELAYRDAEKYYWFPVLRWIDSLNNTTSAIDIGAAYGSLLLYALKTFNIKRSVIIDPVGYLSKTYIDKYRVDYRNVDFEKESVQYLGQFDMLLFTEVLEHLNYHPATTLHKLKSLINPNGYLILSTPDSKEWGITRKYYNYLNDIPAYSGQNDTWIDDHIWQYSFSEIIEILSEGGFDIIDMGYSKGGIARHFCFLLQVKSGQKEQQLNE